MVNIRMHGYNARQTLIGSALILCLLTLLFPTVSASTQAIPAGKADYTETANYILPPLPTRIICAINENTKRLDFIRKGNQLFSKVSIYVALTGDLKHGTNLLYSHTVILAGSCLLQHEASYRLLDIPPPLVS